MSQAQLTKKPIEKFPIGLIYDSPDLSEGAEITACEVTISPDEASGLQTSGLPQIDGAEVSQVVYGGEDGSNYLVAFKVTTSEGNIFKDSIYVKVREI